MRPIMEIEYIIRDGEGTIVHRMYVHRWSYAVRLEWSISRDEWIERISRDSAAKVLRDARANAVYGWTIERKVCR